MPRTRMWRRNGSASSCAMPGPFHTAFEAFCTSGRMAMFGFACAADQLCRIDRAQMTGKLGARGVRLDHETGDEGDRHHRGKDREAAPDDRNARGAAPARIEKDRFVLHAAPNRLPGHTAKNL